MSDPVSTRYKEALQRGHEAVVKGRPREALQHYQEAGRVTDERPLPFISIGSIHLQLDEPEEALRAYEEALRRAPTDLEALRGKARSLEAAGRQDEAQALEQRAGEVDAMQRASREPARVMDQRTLSLETHIAEATRARQAGDLDGAVFGYLAAANGYAQQNSFVAALDACFRALEARPGAIDVHLAMAGLYLRRGWRDHGVQRVVLLDKRLRIDEEPQRRAALTALARAHRTLDPVLDRLASTG